MRRRAQPWLGTLVEITIADPILNTFGDSFGNVFSDSISEQQASDCFDKAFASIANIHRLMSFHDPLSDVTRINQAPVGLPVTIDSHTYTVLRTALALNLETAGLFDINCASTLVEWGYLPPFDQVAPRYVPQSVCLVLQPNHQIKKLKETCIDLGGIAKGYAVDCAINALQQAGVQSACVNAGGDMRAYGAHRYEAALRDPHAPTYIARRLTLHNEALATSAAYFSRKHMDGYEVSPLIDGQNGQAILSHSSVSVFAPSCMLADALTKPVAASGDADYPALQKFGARAFII